MSRFPLLVPSLTLSVLASLVTASTASAHCQVPCGIYGDQLRFERMLEDTTTITKAIDQISELSGQEGALAHNQLARWVMTKEEHASHIQQVIADYFMAQRIKSSNEQYVKQLTAAHNVMVASMKTKQTVDPQAASDLKKAILDFYRAYEGREPAFE